MEEDDSVLCASHDAVLCGSLTGDKLTWAFCQQLLVEEDSEPDEVSAVERQRNACRGDDSGALVPCVTEVSEVLFMILVPLSLVLQR